MHNRLQRGATARLPPVDIHPLCFALIELKRPCQWQKDTRCNNSKGSVCPAPRGQLDERLRRDGTCKCSADERSTRETERKSSVAQTGCVRHEDIQDQEDRIVSHPVDHVARSVGRGVVAGGQDNQTKQVHPDED